jgi:integrase
VAGRGYEERHRKHSPHAHAQRREHRNGEPKTKKSRRSIRLTQRAIEALETHLERQLREIGILGDRYEDQGLLFTTSTGGPINPSNLRQRGFARLLQEARLPHIRFHDLRHTCATLLLAQGTHPKYVQELLGHATIAITLDTYSHVIPGMSDHTARAMQDALSPMDDALTYSELRKVNPSATRAVSTQHSALSSLFLQNADGPSCIRVEPLCTTL